jgi:hypothetical protein
MGSGEGRSRMIGITGIGFGMELTVAADRINPPDQVSHRSSLCRRQRSRIRLHQVKITGTETGTWLSTHHKELVLAGQLRRATGDRVLSMLRNLRTTARGCRRGRRSGMTPGPDRDQREPRRERPSHAAVHVTLRA